MKIKFISTFHNPELLQQPCVYIYIYIYITILRVFHTKIS